VDPPVRGIPDLKMYYTWPRPNAYEWNPKKPAVAARWTTSVRPAIVAVNTTNGSVCPGVYVSAFPVIRSISTFRKTPMVITIDG